MLASGATALPLAGGGSLALADLLAFSRAEGGWAPTPARV